MRTKEQINNISKNFGSPKKVDDCFSSQELNDLIRIFEKSEKQSSLVYKNTGPITLDIKNFLDQKIFQNVIKKIKNEIGNFEITAGFYFWTNFPHIIHNDDTYELPENVYKGITIPLKLYGNENSYPKLCFFDQHYFHGPAKFFKGDKNIPTFYNKQVYEYSEVTGITSESFRDTENLFTHLKPQWLDGLSLDQTLDWIPGSMLVFDSLRLHCASDFRQQGIDAKLGISIFTKKLS